LHVISVDLSELYPELEIRRVDLMYNNAKCRLFAVYMAPRSGSVGRLLQYSNLFSIVTYHCILTLIAGDFNCGDVDWQTLTAHVDGIQAELLNFSITNGFSGSPIGNKSEQLFRSRVQ